ncbi:MAG: hypothetical protein KC776_01045 [Myxococcales bacterium]|nr:hypothetical protein [Myxococcales bacterium]MCB9576542.1 hypothetical protein [Polyangiaceae bacterium]
MKVVVATHGHCFDGLASAAVFTRLLRSVERPTEFVYRACGYGIGQAHPSPKMLTGDQNAILDFRFAPEAAVTWYFDHHRTAFADAEARAVYDERAESERYWFDPAYSSCTKLIADIAREQFGMEDPLLASLVHWADIVDAARFDSAEDAVSRENPVKRLVSVVEHYGDDAFLQRMVGRLLEQPLDEVAALPEIQDRYKPLGEKHMRFVERVRQNGQRLGRVVLVDLTENVLETVGKFVTYALYPDSVYSVLIGLLKNGVKISVGYNPWSGAPLDTDISAICARHGGGGHPVVGGISFRTKELDRARSVAREIAEELAG